MTNSIALNLIAQQATPQWYSQTDSDPAAGGAVFGLSLIMLLIVGAVLYFVPAIVALARHHANAPAIVVLNLLAGWTFIGWVGALVWAISTPQPPSTNVYVQSGTTVAGAPAAPPQSPPGWHQDPHGAGGERWWDGQIWTNQVRGLPALPQGAAE